MPAHAKINPFLRVRGRRDDGYHDIETVVLPISLADGLVVHAFSDPGQFRTLSLSLEISGEPSIVRATPSDESNLALRAAKVLSDHEGIKGFAEIGVDKRIPVAAGLGGGSADAAATLLALNHLWGLGLDAADLGVIASELGSDVPALLRGGPCLIEGRGERTSDVEASSFRWVLVTFDFGVSTAEAYAWWDEDGSRTGPTIDDAIPALQGHPASLRVRLFNDLEDSVIRRHARIGEAKDVLTEAGMASVMSGSGPTVVGLLPDDQVLPAHVEAALERISARSVGYVSSAGGGPSS